MFLTRTSSCKIIHPSGYCGPWPGRGVSVSTSNKEGAPFLSQVEAASCLHQVLQVDTEEVPGTWLLSKAAPGRGVFVYTPGPGLLRQNSLSCPFRVYGAIVNARTSGYSLDRTPVSEIMVLSLSPFALITV